MGLYQGLQEDSSSGKSGLTVEFRSYIIKNLYGFLTRPFGKTKQGDVKMRHVFNDICLIHDSLSLKFNSFKFWKAHFSGHSV